MYAQTAAFYDRIYAAAGKDYRAEATALTALIRRERPEAATLLDVGCGTGAHLEHFAAAGFTCRGVDADLKMIAIARGRCPEVEIEAADMLTLDLGTRFDAVVALFGVAAYARTGANLRRTIASLARHLAPAGVLVIEAWLSRAEYRPGRLNILTIDDEDLKLCRLAQSRQVGAIAVLDFHFLVGTPASGIERVFERHELGLFEEKEYREAFEAAGLHLKAVDVPEIAYGRRIYVGSR